MSEEFAFGPDVQDVRTAVYQAIGSATVGCWDEDGVFKEQRAIAISEALLDFISREHPV